jgi:transposase
MEKYKTEFKLRVVKSNLAGEGGSKLLARRFCVPREKVLYWVNYYQVHGIASLRPKVTVVYSPKFKLQVLSHQEREQLSNNQVAALYDIRNANKIVLWRQALAEGKLTAALGEKFNNLPVKLKPKAPGRTTDSKHELEQALEQNERLRAEVAYLKKLQALIRTKRLAAPTKRG